MSGVENILAGVFSFLPVLLIFVVVAVLSAKKIKERDASSGRKYTKTSGGVQGYAPKEYAREVKEIHQTDPGEDYRRRMDQLHALFENGMMEREEFEDRRAEIEEDYRQELRRR